MEISSFLYHTNERSDLVRGVEPRPQMEIPDLYANSIFVAAREARCLASDEFVFFFRKKGRREDACLPRE